MTQLINHELIKYSLKEILSIYSQIQPRLASSDLQSLLDPEFLPFASEIFPTCAFNISSDITSGSTSDITSGVTSDITSDILNAKKTTNKPEITKSAPKNKPNKKKNVKNLSNKKIINEKCFIFDWSKSEKIPFPAGGQRRKNVVQEGRRCKWWYVDSNGEEVGPVSNDAMKVLWSNGEIGSSVELKNYSKMYFTTLRRMVKKGWNTFFANPPTSLELDAQDEKLKTLKSKKATTRAFKINFPESIPKKQPENTKEPIPQKEALKPVERAFGFEEEKNRVKQEMIRKFAALNVGGQRTLKENPKNYEGFTNETNSSQNNSYFAQMGMNNVMMPPGFVYGYPQMQFYGYPPAYYPSMAPAMVNDPNNLNEFKVFDPQKDVQQNFEEKKKNKKKSNLPKELAKWVRENLKDFTDDKFDAALFEKCMSITDVSEIITAICKAYPSDKTRGFAEQFVKQKNFYSIPGNKLKKSKRQEPKKPSKAVKKKKNATAGISAKDKKKGKSERGKKRGRRGKGTINKI